MVIRWIFGVLLFSIVQVSGAYEHGSYEEWKANMLIELDTTSEEEGGGYLSYAFGSDSVETRNLAALKHKQASDFIAKHKMDPVLWRIKGELKLIEQVVHHRGLRKEGKWDDPKNQALIKEYQSYYRKALDLDDSPDAPAHLDPKMLQSMATDVLAPPDIAKRALRKALDISIAGASPPYGGEKGQYEWYLYEFLLGAYAKAGDYGLYLDTVNEMISRFPNTWRMDELLVYKQDVEATIAKEQNKKAIKKNGVSSEQQK